MSTDEAPELSAEPLSVDEPSLCELWIFLVSYIQCCMPSEEFVHACSPYRTELYQQIVPSGTKADQSANASLNCEKILYKQFLFPSLLDNLNAKVDRKITEVDRKITEVDRKITKVDEQIEEETDSKKIKEATA